MVISWQFILLILGSLLLYSGYINFIYSKQDIKPNKIILSSEINSKKDEVLDNDGIIIDNKNTPKKISLYETGNKNRDKFLSLYSIASSKNNIIESDVEEIGENSREEKLRKEMSCEVLFFEIVAVVFLSVTSLLFKEKNMGTMKVYTVVPSNNFLFILSKLVLFLLLNLIFTILIIGINIGILEIPSIFIKSFLHIGILSIIMTLISHICVFIFRDFKQFGLAYAFIIIIMTAPVFLVANTAIHWNWIEYYPLYILYMAMKDGFFNIITKSFSYYSLSIGVIISLAYITNRIMKKELSRG